jgi:hypothetical protein
VLPSSVTHCATLCFAERQVFAKRLVSSLPSIHYSFGPPLAYHRQRIPIPTCPIRSSYLSPYLLDILLHIRPQPLGLLQRRKVPAALVLLVRGDVPTLLQHVLDAGE